jgi:hypothetical protein
LYGRQSAAWAPVAAYSVRYDAPQTLTAAQQAQARSNINAVSKSGDAIAGDLTVYRPSAPTTGVVYLNQGNSAYLFYDGANYQLPNGNVYASSKRLLYSTGDTMTGDLIVASGASQIRLICGGYGAFIRNDGTSLWLGLLTNSGDPNGSWARYPLQIDLASGNINSQNQISASNGRLWGANDFPNPGNAVSSVRLAYAGDHDYRSTGTSPVEPWGGSVITGAAAGGGILRHRYLQFYAAGNWYTAGYA